MDFFKKIFFFFCGSLLLPGISWAANMSDLLSSFGSHSGYVGPGDYVDQDTLVVIIGAAIKFLLSFLAVIFIILIIYGGYMWMTAAGNEGKVETAKKIIIRSVIGGAIIAIAYLVTWFVMLELAKLSHVTS